MADIWRAYKFINKSLGLRLSDEQLRGAEAAFKRHFMEDLGFHRAEIEKVDQWEFFGHLQPTKIDSFPPKVKL